MGVVSREVELVVGGRVLHLAITVSSLGPRKANSGFVLVFDDLTEVLRAQKSAAWQEVARRIAHEIRIRSRPSNSPRSACATNWSAAPALPKRPRIPISRASPRNAPASSNAKSPPSPPW